MRSNGVPEDKITGDADPYEKFVELTKSLEMAIGNPMYHWCNLELKKYFGITEPLTMKNVKEVWDKTSDMLQNDPNCSVRGLIKQSNVKYIGTTDDPVDSLLWHEKIRADKTIDFMVRPSFRPDKAVNIGKDGFTDYMARLAASVGKDKLASIDDVTEALSERLVFFKNHGCVASDHGIDYVVANFADKATVDAIYKKAMAGEKLTADEVEKYQTYILLFLAKKYKALNIVMEIHYSCKRNVNERMFKIEGPDTGFDVIARNSCDSALSDFFSELDKNDELPKTIVFSLDHNDFNLIATTIGAFQSDECPGKMQMGAAWWFLDTRDGMEEQMRSLANLSLLGNFVGMLTDSRSFLSYTRHDYFRRIFCNLIGNWVENGEYPDDEEALKKIVEGVSYNNAINYFGIN